jgi:hypothetical protein
MREKKGIGGEDRDVRRIVTGKENVEEKDRE